MKSLMGPPTTTLTNITQLMQRRKHHAQLIISLSLLRGRTFTVFDAGFALNTQGSFVNGFTPLRAGFAGVFFNFKFKAPQSLNEPFFLIWSAATPTYASKAPFTSRGCTPVDSATAR